ncbi:AraC family transcriptional regulator [Rhizobium sp. PP-F2F-G48]|uniref:AraC family transcriptional regulator n=1 Tax=Rhizobium sp. PP-F2F-G48 TaxID=2135651 RepID=UPI00104296EA|nr:AraC family transcriptional regulator [Rhizobium sp. PP-F2F-G48]TCM49693.1 AraC family transcriptional regulator [Rhizobium sp. PP-F2F-G48]
MGDIIRGAVLFNFSELVTELGGDPGAIARAQGINPAAIGDFDSFLLYSKALELVGAAVRELQCPDFGMRLGVRQEIHFLGPLAVFLRHSETVADALESVCRYLYLFAPPDVAALKRGPQVSAFTYSIALRHVAHRDQMIEKSLAVTISAFRQLLGNDFTPLRVTMQHQPIARPECYREVFGCPVEFGREDNALEFPTRALDGAIPGRDAAALALAQSYLTDTKPGLDLVDTVREITHRLLKLNRASLIIAADTLNLHPRVLQRRLFERGTTFEEILDDLRRDLCRQLAGTGMHVSEIATVLGYSEQSSYARACRRWYGMSPRKLHSQLAAHGQLAG